jgi:hypothetical protein
MYVEELKDEKEWEIFLEVSPGGTFYHSLEWKRVIQMSFRHHDLYLTIRDENGTIIGICPGFILGRMHLEIYDSMPYSDYGGPVIGRQYIQEASLSLQGFLQNFCSNKGIICARFCFRDAESGQFFRSPLGYVEATRGIMEVDLKATPSDFLLNKMFSANLRRNIRLIERRGFQAQEARTKSDLQDFYHLYYKNMKYLTADPYSYEFIENAWNILHPRHLRVWLLEKDKRVGGMLVFKDDKKSYCVYAGLDREQRIEIVNYLMWREIKKAEEEGRRYVSLGSTPSDPRNPYYIQKKRLGGSFCQQQTIWYPVDSTGCILLLTRAKTFPAWKTIRNLLPTGIRRTLESRLSRF